METEYILGVPVDVVTITEIMNELPSLLKSSRKLTFTSVNPQIVVHAHKYPEVIEFVKASSHRIPDGIGIVKASQKQGGKIKERVTGIDLMTEFLRYANENEKSVFLYGSKPEVLEKTLVTIKNQYPNISEISGIDGYTNLSETEIVFEINKRKPTFVFVALGFPRQEQWLARNYQNVEAQVFQDVGGSFDVLSESVKRAPNFFIKANLEWLYRSLSTPKRLVRMIDVPVFMYKTNKWFKENHSAEKSND